VIGKSIVRRDAESFAPPVDKCQRVEMRGHQLFRDARGAGCEKDVGEIIIYHRDERVLAAVLRKVIGKGSAASGALSMKYIAFIRRDRGTKQCSSGPWSFALNILARSASGF